MAKRKQILVVDLIIIGAYSLFLVFIFQFMMRQENCPYLERPRVEFLSEIPVVQQVAMRINQDGLEKADTKDIVLYTAAHLNDELYEATKPITVELYLFRKAVVSALYGFFAAVIGLFLRRALKEYMS